MPSSQEAKIRAKAIIVELIKQNGGTLCNKTNLFKAFWKANVDAAAETGRPMTTWPIVKMPRGPGIDKFDSLLGELLEEGVVVSEEVQVGSKTAFQFSAGEIQGRPSVLTPDEIRFIRAGVAAVEGMSASAASQWSHDESRSWRSVGMGEELDVVLDSIPNDVFDSRQESMQRINDKFGEVLSL